jgi:hypothetical protein
VRAVIVSPTAMVSPRRMVDVTVPRHDIPRYGLIA